jgi:hypothetical protein
MGMLDRHGIIMLERIQALPRIAEAKAFRDDVGTA